MSEHVNIGTVYSSGKAKQGYLKSVGKLIIPMHVKNVFNLHTGDSKIILANGAE